MTRTGGTFARRAGGPVVLVARVGAASGSRAAAAALAGAGSDAGRAGLLVALGGRPPRPTLIASAAARELEERLAAHVPEAAVAARGQACHLSLPGGEGALERVPAALALAREAVAAVHLPPALFQPALADPTLKATAVLLRADLPRDRALVALVVRDLLDRGLGAAVLKQPLPWLIARSALFGLPAPTLDGPQEPAIRRVLATPSHGCYGDFDGQEADPEGAPQPQRRDHAGPRRR